MMPIASDYYLCEEDEDEEDGVLGVGCGACTAERVSWLLLHACVAQLAFLTPFSTLRKSFIFLQVMTQYSEEVRAYLLVLA